MLQTFAFFYVAVAPLIFLIICGHGIFLLLKYELSFKEVATAVGVAFALSLGSLILAFTLPESPVPMESVLRFIYLGYLPIVAIALIVAQLMGKLRERRGLQVFQTGWELSLGIVVMGLIFAGGWLPRLLGVTIVS